MLPSPRSPHELHRAPLLRRRRRRGEGAMGFVGGVFLLIVVAAAYLAWAWFPAYWDWMAMKEIATTVVRDWTNHENEDRARQRLTAELRRKDVSDDVSVEDCTFSDNKGKYEVECSWTAYAYYPGTSYYKTFDAWVWSNFDGAEGSFGGG